MKRGKSKFRAKKHLESGGTQQHDKLRSRGYTRHIV